MFIDNCPPSRGTVTAFDISREKALLPPSERIDELEHRCPNCWTRRRTVPDYGHARCRAESREFGEEG
jgi:hypothetical protein